MEPNKVLRALGLVAVFCGAACTVDRGESADTSAARLEFGPIAKSVAIGGYWKGSQVELLAADAYHNCTNVEPYDSAGTSSLEVQRQFEHANDKFLEDLIAKMTSAETTYFLNPLPLPTPPPPPQTGDLAVDWLSTRGGIGGPGFDPYSILKPLTPPSPGLKFASSTPSTIELALDTDFRTAGVNLCMAQDLRRHSPGSAANAGLFLPEDQQRQLLEIVRERSQIAMLQYALFASVLAAPEIAPQGLFDTGRLGDISTWLHHLPDSVLTKMGNDFATAVQLNLMATEEMAQLLGRSRSKRDPFGRVTADRADAFWGASSWYQRETALLYGGDPLAMETPQTAGAPWKGLLATPGAGTGGETWPDQLPSFHTELLEPQPQLLLQMARQKGVLKLLLDQPNPCVNVNVTSSARAIYDDVERKLHDEACDATNQGGQCIPWSLPQNLPDEQYWLLTRHHITRAHATTMASWLKEALTSTGSSCATGYQGAISIDSTIPYDKSLPPQSQVATVVWTSGSIEIKPHASFVPRPLESVGGLYSRMAPIHLADVRDVDPNNSNVGVLGFNGSCIAFQNCGWNYGVQAEAKRVMGAIPAAAAVARILRGALFVADIGQNPTSKAAKYLASAEKTHDLVRAASGGSAVSVRPVTVDLLPPYGFYQGTGDYVPTLLLDPSTSDISCDGAVEVCTLYAVYDQLDAPDLAAHPNAVLDKGGLRSVASMTNGAFYGTGTRIWGGRAVEFGPTHFQYGSGVFSLVLRRDRNSVFYKFDHIAGQVRVHGSEPYPAAYDGQDLAFGGELGTIAARANEPLQRNPVEPAYDGFGWETHWVPPLTAAFLGGDPSQPSVDPMLKIAEQSADEAEKAIETAVTGLLERQKDDAQVAAAQAKSNQAIKQERDGLCGPNATKEDCDAGATRVKSAISVNGWYGLPAPTQNDCSNPVGTQAIIGCLLQNALQGMEATEVQLAGPVDAVKTQSSAPAFQQYAGGSLQSAFIEQWRAVRSLGGKIRAIQDNASATQAAVDAANTRLAQQESALIYKCTAGLALAALGGVSTGFANASFSPAGLMAAMQDCQLSAIGLPADISEAVAKELGALASLSASLTDVSDYLAALQQSSAKVESLSAQAKMGQARAELDADLAKSTAVTSFPLYRNFRDADLWRAKATVESARRYALAARRALEARYVVDLTRLDQKETFVSAPSVWADDIYGYDLSLPSAVGLTIPTSDQKDPNAIYKAAIKDYVANLRGFINGYAASRPSAVAQEDIDVVNLSGFVPFGNVNESPGAWQLLCGTNWVSLDAYKNAPGGWNCGTSQPGPKATRARVGFVLDPWGRLNGTIGNEPYTKRYNTRWGKVALNVVGTGVKDCSLANDPLACYANSTIRYNLTHVTPTWTTDYDGLWREQDMPLGQIEGGKGLAVELFLNPLKDGWNTQFISAVARTEYLFRPAGGAYNLEFEVTPEVMLQRIERMQLLVGTSAWVKQK